MGTLSLTVRIALLPAHVLFAEASPATALDMGPACEPLSSLAAGSVS